MKKIFVLLTALCLFVAACNNNKAGKNQNANNREKDDYGKSENTGNKDEKMTDGNTVNKVDDNNNAMMSGWSQSEKDAFISNCVTNATQNGTISKTVAQNYCDCMLNKMETLYPNVEDAGKLTDEDLNSPEMQKMVKDCLKTDN